MEKHFGELCQIFAAYVRKTARLRDKADLLVNEINVYASTETPGLEQGLKKIREGGKEGGREGRKERERQRKKGRKQGLKNVSD